METTFESKCSILAEVFIDYKRDDEFADFIEYNDLGLPLAYAVDTKLVKPSNEAKSMIEETFDLLVTALEIEDTGFESLDQMLDNSTPFAE